MRRTGIFSTDRTLQVTRYDFRRMKKMAASKITKEDVQETVEKAAKVATKQAKAASKAATKAATEAKKSVKRAATKTTTTVTLQFGGKEIDTDALVKTAKDIWRYDMGRKMADLKNVDIYVKPEENRAYYVLNDETGSFEL